MAKRNGSLPVRRRKYGNLPVSPDNLRASGLNPLQIEALRKVCSTDEAINDMLSLLKLAKADKRWLQTAEMNFNCAMMQVYSAILAADWKKTDKSNN